MLPVEPSYRPGKPLTNPDEVHSGFGVDRDGDGGSGPVHLSRFEAGWGVRQPDLHALEAVRTNLLQQLQSLGDFRPGSIGAQVRRCGRPTCHCARPNDAGHDHGFGSLPGWRARTSPRVFPLPPPYAKPSGKSPGFSGPQRRTHQRQREYLPTPSGRTRTVAGRCRKKTAAAIHQEVAWEVDSLRQRIFADRRHTGSLDSEAVEMAFRTAVHKAGAPGLPFDRGGAAATAYPLRLRPNG